MRLQEKIRARSMAVPTREPEKTATAS